MKAELERRGYDVILYLTDLVMKGLSRFELRLGCDGELTVSCDGCPIGPEDVAAAWYWKVANFALPDADTNLAKQLSMVNEVAQLNNSVWSLYPDARWLSSPRAISQAERKLLQLITAHQVGFEIPETFLSSSWLAIEGNFQQTDYIVKMFRGVTAEGNKVKAMYTTHLRGDLVERLRQHTVPFPGIYQPFLTKAREWRVTAVGDDTFAASIYTDDDAKQDWRRLQETASVAMRREQLPQWVADLCCSYLRKMDLGLGSFDLVESPDGRITFLECNPNGQFGFLEEVLNLPISGAVADAIARVASKGS